MIRQLVYTIGLLLTALWIGEMAFAAQITKVKGGSILIDMQGDAATRGETFFAINPAGKKKAIVQITKIKGNKALARLIKGQAAAGMTLAARAAGGKVATSAKRSSRTPGLERAYWGGIIGYGMDTMSVDVQSALVSNKTYGTANMTGGGISGKALVDYELFKQIWYRGALGVEQFNVAGGSICGTANAGPCDAKLLYFSLDFIIRYMFTTGQIRPWIGAGLGLLFPATKASTALAESSVGTTNVLQLLGGVDYSINPRMYIPISVEYGMLPKSEQVRASWIAARVGLAVAF